MIQSMTGFGAAEIGGFRIEIRSLNHRFMDISIKCPPAISKYEMVLRESLKNKFIRGKFDIYISFLGNAGVKARLNKVMANDVFSMLSELKEELDIKEEIRMESLLGWKELFIEDEASYDPEELLDAFNEALEGLESMRIKEGKVLISDINQRVASIDELVDGIVARCPEVLDSLKARFLERLNKFLEGVEHDDNRLIQEAAALAEKCDITEEIVRLKGHINHIRNILKDSGAIGRKIDFLVQELNREANTIASKSYDSGISESIIKMKAEIERIREQVQNVQ